MSENSDADGRLREQYADAARLSARFRLHAAFSVNPYGWLRWVFDHLDLPPRCRLLELGCGTGWLWLNNRARIPPGWQITLSDFSAGMIKEAQAALRDLGRELSFQVIDAQAIPFPDASLDAVIANHVLYHVPDLDGALAEVRRVLTGGGRLYAATNGADHMRELRDLVRAVGADVPFVRNANSEVFGLENGAARLRPHFAEVRLHRYEDALEVTQARPLIEYVLSLRLARAALPAGAVAELERIIQHRIAADGKVHVTKSTGIFTAPPASR